MKSNFLISFIYISFFISFRNFGDLIINYCCFLIIRHDHFLIMSIFLLTPHIHRLPYHHRFRMVVVHSRRPVMQHLSRHVFLCVHIQLFLPRRILKTQFVKPVSLVGF
ncbi:hypothetical protein CIFRMM088M_24020 [Citrobacter freundii]